MVSIKMSSKTVENPYQPQNVLLFELIYGKHLISLGGLDAIENMFSDIKLTGLNALDIGFGLGGVAFYLAQNYQMRVQGLEIHEWMVKHAKQQAPEELAGFLKFSSYAQDGLIPFATNSFDLVYSKGVLNHVHDKENLLTEAYRVLKFNGTLIIADWIYHEVKKNKNNPLVCETQSSYEQALTEAGFTNITFRDDSKLFLNYTKKLIENLNQNQEVISRKFGRETYEAIYDDHHKLLNDITHAQKLAVRIKAGKI